MLTATLTTVRTCDKTSSLRVTSYTLHTVGQMFCAVEFTTSSIHPIRTICEQGISIHLLQANQLINIIEAKLSIKLLYSY